MKKETTIVVAVVTGRATNFPKLVCPKNKRDELSVHFHLDVNGSLVSIRQEPGQMSKRKQTEESIRFQQAALHGYENI